MRLAGRLAIALLWLTATAGLVGLGTWQVHRRAWKLDLIAQVDARLAAAPVPAPLAAEPDDAYRRIRATGRFIPARDSFVQAVTERGAGWWVLSPLRTPAGIILVNRGFVPDHAAPTPPAGPVTVTGLLRLTEPGGGFLRSNAPALDQWYSRDVAAIAVRRHLEPTAPYFIDADASTPEHPGQPVGGLTVVQFTNNHLVYAITWYTLVAMSLAALVFWLTGARRRRQAFA